VTVLHAVHRFASGSGIDALSRAVQGGDVEGSLDVLRNGGPDVRWVDPADARALADVVAEAARVGVTQVEAALEGDAEGSLAAAGALKVLAATRQGPLGLGQWTSWIEREVADDVTAFQPGRRWHVGRPVLVTANDPAARVYNGDTGVVVATDGGPVVALETDGSVRTLPPARLDQVETWWAMTIHKSQGSEYPVAVVSLPAAPSPILTRELLYTAVTRARERLVVVADEGALRAAVARPLARASGLRERLWSS
jgi:exodeoxyribonuclease V alpha subunit